MLHFFVNKLMQWLERRANY